ncbi:MAG: tetratricopeptide repeat protein [Colwellia sp.]
MNRLSLLSLLLILPFLFACQNQNSLHTSTHLPSNSLYLDNNFAIPEGFAIETEQDIFMLDDEMQAMVARELKGPAEGHVKAKALIKHIFSKEDMALSYENHANLIAREAYHSHKANCISLTIMAFALAEAADLNVSFQQVDVPEYWVRNGQYSAQTGHVNLLVKFQNPPSKDIVFGNNNLVIDFDPFVQKKKFKKKTIRKNTVIAMFYNNKGSEALVEQRYNVAYQYFRAATKVDSHFSSAWGNLAVLYKLTDNHQQAELAYRYAIKISPSNLTALANLAILLRHQNNLDEAAKIEKKLYYKRHKNPYYHALLADEAYFRQNYQQALIHYKDAIALDSKIHEFHFGVAKTYYQLQHLTKAQKSLKKAMYLTKRDSTEQLYAAKLELLKAQRTN